MKPIYVFNLPIYKKVYDLLNNIKFNPYTQYSDFLHSINDLVHDKKIPICFVEACSQIYKDRESQNIVCHLIKNCPIDKNLPFLDHLNPLKDKYQKKETFVAEGFLQLYAILTKSPLLAYTTRSNGDFFHDVYFDNKYRNTQTQKTDSELYPHNDRTAHPIRADYINLLGLRSSNINTIMTNYYHGQRIISLLDQSVINILKEPLFVTPFDLYSKDSNAHQIESMAHAIIEDGSAIRYYHNRTTYLNTESLSIKKAFDNFIHVIEKAKIASVNIQSQDLFSCPNLYGLHERKFIKIKDYKQARERWLLKTYNFESQESLSRFTEKYHPQTLGIVID